MRSIASTLVTQNLQWILSRLYWQKRLTRLVTAERTPVRRRVIQPVRS